MISTEESIIRLIIAIILGGLIGYEREAQSKSAGFRTHTLVCVGSCLCMILSINIAMGAFFAYGYHNSDPERIAAQVVSGVGFIGAGTILANQKNRSVRGLTTAAGLWAVAAIGLTVGAGYIVVAVVSTVIIFLVLTVFVRFDARLSGRFRKKYVLEISMRNTVGQARKLSLFLQDKQLKIKKFTFHNDEEAPLAEVTLELTATRFTKEEEMISQLLAIKGVKKAHFYVADSEEKKEKDRSPFA